MTGCRRGMVLQLCAGEDMGFKRTAVEDAAVPYSSEAQQAATAAAAAPAGQDQALAHTTQGQGCSSYHALASTQGNIWQVSASRLRRSEPGAAAASAALAAGLGAARGLPDQAR